MKDLQKIKKIQRKMRHQRVRVKIIGTARRPRLSVSRSIKHVAAQLIDDTKNHTLASVSDVSLGKKKVGKRKRVIVSRPKDLGEKSVKTAIAYEVGKLIAKKAKEIGIQSVVFDRGGHQYHGRVKAVALGAREGGLKF